MAFLTTNSIYMQRIVFLSDAWTMDLDLFDLDLVADGKEVHNLIPCQEMNCCLVMLMLELVLYRYFVRSHSSMDMITTIS